MYYLHYTYRYSNHSKSYDDFSDAMTALHEMLSLPSYGRDYEEAFIDENPEKVYENISYDGIPYDIDC